MITCPFCETKIDLRRRGRWKRYVCTFCLSESDEHTRNYRGNHGVPSEKIRALLGFLRAGYTSRTAAMLSATGYMAAQGYAWRMLDAGEKLLCSCGKFHSHGGYCWWRVVNDPTWKAMAERRARKLLSVSTSIGVVWRPEEEVFYGKRCKEKACPFGVADERLEVCEYHRTFFAHDISLVDVSIGGHDLSKSEDRNEHFMGNVSVIGIRDMKLGARLIMQRPRPQFTKTKVDKPRYWQSMAAY